MISVFIQIAKGLGVLHENNLLHRDIAARNILVLNATDNDMLVKISDFDSVVESALSPSVGGHIFLDRTALVCARESDACSLEDLRKPVRQSRVHQVHGRWMAPDSISQGI